MKTHVYSTINNFRSLVVLLNKRSLNWNCYCWRLDFIDGRLFFVHTKKKIPICYKSIKEWLFSVVRMLNVFYLCREQILSNYVLFEWGLLLSGYILVCVFWKTIFFRFIFGCIKKIVCFNFQVYPWKFCDGQWWDRFIERQTGVDSLWHNFF